MRLCSLIIVYPTDVVWVMWSECLLLLTRNPRDPRNPWTRGITRRSWTWRTHGPKRKHRIKDLVGSKDLKEIQDPRVRRVYQEAKVNRASRDALDPQDHQVNKEIKGQGDKQEAKVNQVLVVSKVHREPSEVIGNSVYLRVWMMKQTLVLSR